MAVYDAHVPYDPAFPTALISHDLPQIVWIKAINVVDHCIGRRAKVNFVHHPMLIHGEGLHARFAVFCRPSDQSETGDHVAVYDVIVGAPSDLVALASKNFLYL